MGVEAGPGWFAHERVTCMSRIIGRDCLHWRLEAGALEIKHNYHPLFQFFLYEWQTRVASFRSSNYMHMGTFYK